MPGDTHSRNLAQRGDLLTGSHSLLLKLRSRSSLGALRSAIGSKALLLGTLAERQSDEHGDEGEVDAERYVSHVPAEAVNDERRNNAEDERCKVRARRAQRHAEATLVRRKPARDNLRENRHQKASAADAADGPRDDCGSKARAAEQAEKNRTDGRQSARQRHSPTRADLIAQHAPHQRQAGVENHEHRSDQANLGVADAQRLSHGIECDRR